MTDDIDTTAPPVASPPARLPADPVEYDSPRAQIAPRIRQLLCGVAGRARRTLERGEKLSSRFGGEAMRLADLPARLAEFDIVISCTASTLPLIGLGAVERALKQRKHRPMFMVDLAVPRDIEPEVERLSDVFLYTVDTLSTLVQRAGERREAAVAQAEAIIEVGVQGFVHWLDQRGSIPLIQALHAQSDEWRAIEIGRAKKLLAGGEDVGAVLESLSRGVVQKMLHGALAELRSAEIGRNVELVRRRLRRLLGLLEHFDRDIPGGNLA